MEDFSLSLKSDIVHSCTMEKSDNPSAKCPDILSSQGSKTNSATSQNNNNNDACRTDNVTTEERPVETITEDLEPALRRSKRGKGRPSNTHNANNNNNNNDGTSDDHVPSCIISGTEYHTGDFVYYEEPDFEYYTIGLIEEIKVSRRDKFSIFIKCFYRTRDIPDISKQGLPDRDNYPINSNIKLIRDIFARELFVSEVQETLPAKQLRGLCKVNYLPDLKTALSTFSPEEDDSFFYVFAYNPETRRLSKIRAEIRVGQAYQALLPEFRHSPPAMYRFGHSRGSFRSIKRSRKSKITLETSYKSDQDVNTLKCLRKSHSLSPYYRRKYRCKAIKSVTATNTTTESSNNHDSLANQPTINDTLNISNLDNNSTISMLNNNKTLKTSLELSQTDNNLISSNNHVTCEIDTIPNLSEDMKNSEDNNVEIDVQQQQQMDTQNSTQLLNLPPKLENANDFKDSLNTITTSDYSHHRKHHSLCMHKNHSYYRKQLRHHRKKRHRRLRRRWRQQQSQCKEVLVWSPGGLSSALSGTSKKFDFSNNTAYNHNNINVNDINDNFSNVSNNISTDFNSMLSDEPLKNYLDAVRSMVAFFGFGGADDDLASAENGLVLANLAATTQHAYDTLHKCNYSLRNALQAISCNPIVAKDTPRHWTTDQVRLFAHALRIHGKDFFKIQRNFFGGKTFVNNNNNDNNNNNSTNNNGNNVNGVGLWNSSQAGNGRIRGRGRRKLGGTGGSGVCSSASTLKLSTLKSDEIGSSTSVATVVPSKLDEVKPEDSTFVPTSGSSHDGGESVENAIVSGTTTLKGSNCNDESTLSTGLPVTNEPIKTVKELIAFYYYWKRKGASSCSSSSSSASISGVGGGGHGGLSSVAANFATAVVAATLNTTTTDTSVAGANNNYIPSSLSGNTTPFESANNLNGSAFSTQAHITSVSVKKRKPTNRGCVLTKQAWLGIIEHRKAAEYELRRLLTLKYEKNDHNNINNHKKNDELQHQKTVNYSKSTLINDDKSESIDPSHPESEIEENYDLANTGHDDVDIPVTSSEKAEEITPVSTTSSADSLSTSRSRKRVCRNCSVELASTGESPPSPMPNHHQLGQLRFLCSDCRIHLQKYGELKCTLKEEEINNPSETLNSISNDGKLQKKESNDGNLLDTIQEDELDVRHGMKDDPSTEITVNSMLDDIKPTCSLTTSSTTNYRRKHKKHSLNRLNKQSHSDNYDSSTSFSSSSSLCSLNLHMDKHYSTSSSASSSPRSSQLEDEEIDEEEDSDSIGSDYESNSSHSCSSIGSSISCKSPLIHHELNEVNSECPSYRHMNRKRRKNSHLRIKGKKHICNDMDYMCKPPPKLDDNRDYDCSEDNQCFSIQPKIDTNDSHCSDTTKTVLQSSEILSSSNLIDSRDTKGHISNVLYSNTNNSSSGGTNKLDELKKDSTMKLSAAIDINNNGDRQSPGEIDDQQRNNDADDDDNSMPELEIDKLITATNESNPLSCFIDAHRSTWSHLVRIWDRQIQYSHTTTTPGTDYQSTKIETNLGSCARTDLVYCGRGLDNISMNNREFWNMQKYNLFTKYADTAIGPGVNLYLSSSLPNTLDNSINVVSSESITKSEILNLTSPNANYTNMSCNPSPGIHDSSSTALDLCSRNSSKRSYIPSSTTDQPCTKSRRSFQCDTINNPYMHSVSLNVPNTSTSCSTMLNSSSNIISNSQILPTGAGLRPTVNTITTTTTNTNNNNMSSQQQRQLQTMYEQALIFAAAAAGHYQHSPPVPSGPVRETCKFFPTNLELNNQMKQSPVVSSPNLRFISSNSSNSNNNNNPLMSTRLGAATGTFYPPISSLSTSTGISSSLSCGNNNNNSFGINKPSISGAPFNFNLTDSQYQSLNLPPPQMAMSASGVGSTSILHGSNFNPTTGSSISSSYNGLGSSSSNSSVPGNQLYNHPEFLQRQLALMGLLPPGSIPPEHMMPITSVEQREIEAFQRLMTERLEYLRNTTNNINNNPPPPPQQQQQQRTITPVEQIYQHHQQQQELFAAAFSAEMASRLESISSIYSNQDCLFPLSFNLSHCETNNGAMTSAVNSISTRPTASVQLPQNTRFPQSIQCNTPLLTNRFPTNHSDIHNINKTPPIAHHNSSYSTSRDSSTNLNVNISPMSLNVVPTRAQPNIPFSTPISHGTNRSTARNSNTQSLSSSSSSSNIQEQVLNAAKLAMMAANMQSDPNKALTFASLAAAAFTEMASSSQDKKLPSRSNDHSSSSHHPLSGIQENLSQRNMNIPTSNMRLRSPVGSSSGQYNADCNNSIPTPGVVLSNFMHQNTHKERRRQNSHLASSNIASHSPGVVSQSSNRLQSPPVHYSHSESRSFSNDSNNNNNNNRTPTPAANRIHQSLSGNNDSSFVAGSTVPGSGGGIPPAQLAQLAHLAQMSGLPPGFSFQDPAVLNAFALAAAATSLVASGANQPDMLTDTNISANPGDRYRSPIPSYTSPQPHQQRYPPTNSQTQQQQQQKAAAAAAAAAAMANAFGLQSLPAQFNPRLSSQPP